MQGRLSLQTALLVLGVEAGVDAAAENACGGQAGQVSGRCVAHGVPNAYAAMGDAEPGQEANSFRTGYRL